MWAWLSTDMSTQKKPSFLTASPWVQSKGLSVFLMVLSFIPSLLDEVPYSELPTLLHSPWKTANIPDAGPYSLFLQMPAEVWHPFPDFNSEMISTLVVPTVCCFVHYYIKSLYSHTNLNHTRSLRACWPPCCGRQPPGGVYPSLPSSLTFPRLTVQIPVCTASTEWTCPVFDWLHPSWLEIVFSLYWKLLSFSRFIQLLLLLCFIYASWLLALKMDP